MHKHTKLFLRYKKKLRKTRRVSVQRRARLYTQNISKGTIKNIKIRPRNYGFESYKAISRNIDDINVATGLYAYKYVLCIYV